MLRKIFETFIGLWTQKHVGLALTIVSDQLTIKYRDPVSIEPSGSRVLLWSIPAMTSQLFQPCNIGPLSLYKGALQEQANLSGLTLNEIKEAIMSLHSKIEAQAFAAPTIVSSFEKACLFPYDPVKMVELIKQHGPSQYQ